MAESRTYEVSALPYDHAPRRHRIVCSSLGLETDTEICGESTRTRVLALMEEWLRRMPVGAEYPPSDRIADTPTQDGDWIFRFGANTFYILVTGLPDAPRCRMLDECHRALFHGKQHIKHLLEIRQLVEDLPLRQLPPPTQHLLEQFHELERSLTS